MTAQIQFGQQFMDQVCSMAVENSVICRTTSNLAFVLSHLCFQIVSEGINDRFGVKFPKGYEGHHV